MCKGAFQIDRSIFESEIWTNQTEFRVFFYILGNAIFKKEGIKKADILIKRGQFLRSYRKLQSDLGYKENKTIKEPSLSTLKRAIDNLVKKNRLKIESTELGTLFTVLNYDTYQGFDRFENENVEQQRNSSGTVAEQQQNNKKNVSKKEKKEKNDYKSIYDFYLTLNLFRPRAYTSDISKAIQKAMSDNKYTEEYCMTLLNRHREVVELTKDSDHPVKSRPLTEFFGQKAYQATHLICSEYEEGGKLYEKYLNGDYVPDELAGYNFKN